MDRGAWQAVIHGVADLDMTVTGHTYHNGTINGERKKGGYTLFSSKKEKSFIKAYQNACQKSESLIK